MAQLDDIVGANLRLDPFERFGDPEKGTLNGAQGFFNDWFVYEFWRFVFVQQEVAKLAVTAVNIRPCRREPALTSTR